MRKHVAGVFTHNPEKRKHEETVLLQSIKHGLPLPVIEDMRSGEDKISREAADPSMILFQGKYYIFAPMTLSVWVSEDMVHWESHRLPDSLPLYDYAPDVRVVGDYVYFMRIPSWHDLRFLPARKIS